MTRSKVVFVLGGVCSSLGKGVTAASLARLIASRGYSVANAKIDPYLNVDAGTLAPSEHGEVYVTADAGQGTYSGECDLDFGHYERFTGVDASAAASITSGSVYATVLAGERRGDAAGGTVQVIPHIVEGFMARVDELTTGADHPEVCVVEVGGTVGDMEIDAVLEALRRLREMWGHEQVAVVHLALVPSVGPNGELKTKPAQHSVVRLRAAGITPDVIVARAGTGVPASAKVKLSRLCGVAESRVISAPDVGCIYSLPEHFADEGLDVEVLDLLGLDRRTLDIASWSAAVANLAAPPPEVVRVGLVGKYSDGHDTYLSVLEALRHAAAARGRSCDVVYVDAATLEADGPEALAGLGIDGLVVPGGFGPRGAEGKVAAASWARAADVPYLGLCLGLQVAVVAAVRAAGVADATSTEWGRPGTPAVTILADQEGVVDIGGTLRLGAQPALLTPGSVVARLYGADVATERHRHRYEVNPAVHGLLDDAGIVVSGWSPDRRLVEFIEDPTRRFYVATQAHPEFTSRPDRPNPLFAGFVAACVER